MDPDGEFFISAILGYSFWSLFADTVLFATVAGFEESNEGGSFLEGFGKGIAFGILSSLTGGLTTEFGVAASLAETKCAALTAHGLFAAKASGTMYSVNQLALLSRHGLNEHAWDGIFPIFGHHGAWGHYGISILSVLPLPSDPFVKWVYGAGWGLTSSAVLDDFIQHSIMQQFYPTYLSPLHLLWENRIKPSIEYLFGG